MRPDDLGAWPHDLLPPGRDRDRERARVLTERLVAIRAALDHPPSGADFTRCCVCGVDAPLDAREFIRQGWTFTDDDRAVVCPATHDDVRRLR